MKTKHILYLSIFSSLFSSCKDAFLEIKQNQSLVIPTTLKDYQGLIDNSAIMNAPSCHTLGLIGADEYFLSDAIYKALPLPYLKTTYTWDKDPYPNTEVEDWNYTYWHILYANTALSGVERLKNSSDTEALNNLKGCALFHRGLNYYQLVQTFCKPYDAATAATDPGIPLRLEEDINLSPGRGTLQQTYNQILSDLGQAADLLPVNPTVKFRPGKAAAYAMLAKTWLQMGNYSKALEYCSAYLRIKPELLDFNSENLTLRYPFTDFNTNNEVIFVTLPLNNPVTGPTRANISPSLLNSYTSDDLRKQAYFFNNTDGRVLFKGSYRAQGGYFTGIATDEVYLIRAECFARMGETGKALLDLNTLRKNRYAKASYADVTAVDATTALKLIIAERRKEFLFRGIRWEDLRRFNKEPEFAITQSRTISGITYTIPPNDNRYTWPIPDKEITLGSLEQNIK